MDGENIIGSGIGQASDFFGDAPSYEENEDFLDDDFEDEELEDEELEDEELEDEELEDGNGEEEPEEDSEGEEAEEAGETYAPEEYLDVVKMLAGVQLGLLDAQGNPVEPQSNMMVDVAQRYENQLRYQKLENDILKLQGQDEDFNEVAPTFAQTVLDMPQILEYENGANILYQIAKANYIQTILPQIVNELVEERAKDTAKKKSFQTRTSAGSSRADSGAKDIMSGIMAEAQRTAKLF